MSSLGVAKIPFSSVINPDVLIAFKTTLLSMPAQEMHDEIKKHFPFYTADSENIVELNILFMIYGFLTHHLFNLSICRLVIKGGKILQQWHPAKSSDIDIMLLPIDEETPLSDAKYIAIGLDISNFILWIDSDRRFGWSSLSKIPPHSVRSIYKISKPHGFSWTALSDIGIGYNYLGTHIQQLYSEKCIKHSNDVGLQTMFIILCAESFVKEKMYYAILYYSANAILAQKSMTRSEAFEFEANNAFIAKAMYQLSASGIFDNRHNGPFIEMVHEATQHAQSFIPPNNFVKLFEISYNDNKRYVEAELIEHTQSNRRVATNHTAQKASTQQKASHNNFKRAKGTKRTKRKGKGKGKVQQRYKH
jgi:hypothetical protein